MACYGDKQILKSHEAIVYSSGLTSYTLHNRQLNRTISIIELSATGTDILNIRSFILKKVVNGLTDRRILGPVVKLSVSLRND